MPKKTSTIDAANSQTVSCKDATGFRIVRVTAQSPGPGAGESCGEPVAVGSAETVLIAGSFALRREVIRFGAYFPPIIGPPTGFFGPDTSTRNPFAPPLVSTGFE